MLKLTKSLPVIKERNCSASLVLDTRTNRKNASEFTHCFRSAERLQKMTLNSKGLFSHCFPEKKNQQLEFLLSC